MYLSYRSFNDKQSVPYKYETTDNLAYPHYKQGIWFKD